MSNLDKMILEFCMFSVIFFALQAVFTSIYSFFNIGIMDKAIHTKISISSGLILKIFNGVHRKPIVFAIPCNSCCLRVYISNVTYKEQLNGYPKSI